MEKKNRIVLFWTLTILGFLSHSLADALPAFWGQSIVAEQGPAPVGMMAFMVCLTYLVPVIGILLMVYGGKTAKVINAVLACFVALFTLLHMSELLEAFNPVQLFIMPMMFVVALLMAIDSVKVCKEK
jgi:hypothetical protein